MATPELLHRAALRPNSYDAGARSVEVVWSTGAGVPRRDQRGAYTELLSLDPAHINLERLVGASVLNGHRQSELCDVIGVVEEARIEAGQGVALLRLSARPDVEPIVTDIAGGVIRHVSIGYRVDRWQDGRDESGHRTRTAVAWAPFEVSFVPVPADPGASVRNSPPMTTEANDNRAELRGQIRAIARTAGLPPEWADEQIDAEADIIAARAAAFEAMRGRTSTNIRTQTADPANDDPAVILTRRTDALFARVNGSTPTDAARPYMGERLVDHARAILSMRGQSMTGMDSDAIFRAAMHTTSDFPSLLAGVGNRTLLPAYQSAQSPLKILARQALLSDFRTASRLKLSEVGPLQKVTEGGEIKNVSRGEATESYALDTYASMFALSRKALINDDLGAFRDWGIAAGRAAAETEANLLFNLLTQSSGAGPVMGEDGKRLFHIDHKNLSAASSTLFYYDINQDPPQSGGGLDEARIAMRQQKGVNAKSPINATPKYLLVGPALETEAERVLAETSAWSPKDVNPWAGKLTAVVEPRITDKSWYLFADPAQLAVLEYAYLSSAPGPQIASREGWDVLGTEFRVVLDFGCGVVDWRGAYRNPGVA